MDAAMPTMIPATEMHTRKEPMDNFFLVAKNRLTEHKNKCDSKIVTLVIKAFMQENC